MRWPFLLAALTLPLVFSAQSAAYQFLEGFNVLDSKNYGGLDPAFHSGTSGLERGIALDPTRNIIYIARGLANVGSSATDQDGRPNAVAAPAAIVLGPFNGSNYKDTGLMTAAVNPLATTIPISFHQNVAYDRYADRVYVFGGTNANEGSVTITPSVYSAPGGSLGGAPNGGDPSAVNPIFAHQFKVPNDLSRAGSQRGMAVRSAPGLNGSTVTTIYLAMGSHAQAWRNDNGDLLSPTYPWRRIWATLAPPEQDLCSKRHSGTGSPIDAIAVDDEGNCYFNVRSTIPARIWCVPANASALTSSTNSLDFDDRYFGGFNGGGAAVILPVVPRFAPPSVVTGDGNLFQKPSGLTYFRQNGRKGLFVSLTSTDGRGIARLMIDPPVTSASGGGVIHALIADAFGGVAPLSYQDTVLSTLRLRGVNVTQPSAGSKGLLYTDVNTMTNPTHIYFNAFVTDPSKGQTIPHATIGKASIPPLPDPVTFSSITPQQGFVTGGTEVTIIGSNFNESTSVRFNGVEAAGAVIDSPTQLRAITPPHPSGMTDVALQNPGSDTTTLANAFFFKEAPAPFPVSISFLENGTAILYWPTNPGDRYRVQYKESFEALEWSSFVTVTATGTALTFEDRPVTNRFYRVELLP